MIQLRHNVKQVLFAVSTVVLLTVLLFGLWPFRRQRFIHSLELLSVCQVSAETFEPVFFPTPGYHATGLSFTRWQNGRRLVLATVRGLTAKVSWPELLTWNHKIEVLSAVGLKINIPLVIPKAPAYPTEERLEPIIGRLDANDAYLRVKRRGENPDIEVKFSALTVSNIGKDRQMIIAGTAHNMLPSVDISLKGVFGPFRWSDMKRTPLSGMILLKHLNLNQMQSLGGTGSGYAIVAGPFNHLDMHGSLNSQDFHSLNSRIATSMRLDLAAILDGATGNTWFHETRAHFLHSDIYAYGSLIYDDLGRRHTELFLKSRDADCGEIFKLLLTSAPPLLGNLNFDAHSKVLSGHDSLIDRLNLTGNFRVTDARFRNEQIQTRLEKLSRRIQQSHLKGRPSLKDTSLTLVGNVVVEDGAAQFPSLQLRTPGLIAVGEGALSLAKPTIAMHGQMELDSSLSQAIGGFKGILALPLDPFFSKHGMTVVPFVLDGPVTDPILKTLRPKRPKTSN